MRVLVCANLLIGDADVLNMPAEILQQWHQDKIEALASVLELGRENGVDLCIMAGGLFADGFIPQGLLEKAVEELGSHDIPVTWLPLQREARDLNTRISLPGNVTIDRECKGYIADAIRVVHSADEIALLADTEVGVSTYTLGNMEPMGFGEQAMSSVLFVDVKDGLVVNVEERTCAFHPFMTKTVDLTSAPSPNEMLVAVQLAIEGVSEKSCLRLVLHGSTPLSSYFNVEKLTQVLRSRFFYVEVSNECTVDLAEDELDTDVSLLAEFVRMVDADDSLSPAEKTRIMRCGWNALNGKELVE